MTARVLYSDVIPYDTPSSLTALRGPATGVVDLPRTVHWGPQSRYDLSTPGGVDLVYRNVVREGTTAQQEQYLNADVLRNVWRELALPPRCRQTWEQKFPELAA